MCEGSLVAVGRAESTLYSCERTVYTVKYDIDGTREDLEEEEIRPLLLELMRIGNKKNSILVFRPHVRPQTRWPSMWPSVAELQIDRDEQVF